jgi:predicted O-methyltransferase YrrM
VRDGCSVCRGGSTRALLAAAEATDGHLVSIDSADCLAAIPPERRGRWTFLYGQSDEVLPILGGPFDFALIDGDHTYKSTLNELREMDRLMAPGALVMLDDVWEPEYPGCRRAFDEFGSSRVRSKQLFRSGVSQSVFGRDRTFGLIRFL